MSRFFDDICDVENDVGADDAEVEANQSDLDFVVDDEEVEYQSDAGSDSSDPAGAFILPPTQQSRKRRGSRLETSNLDSNTMAAPVSKRNRPKNRRMVLSDSEDATEIQLEAPGVPNRSGKRIRRIQSESEEEEHDQEDGGTDDPDDGNQYTSFQRGRRKSRGKAEMCSQDGGDNDQDYDNDNDIDGISSTRLGLEVEASQCGYVSQASSNHVNTRSTKVQRSHDEAVAAFEQDLHLPTDPSTLESSHTLGDVICKLWPNLTRVLHSAAVAPVLGQMLSGLTFSESDQRGFRVHKVCRYMLTLETFLRNSRVVMVFLSSFFEKGLTAVYADVDVNLCIINLLTPTSLGATLLAGVTEVCLEERVKVLRDLLRYSKNEYSRFSSITQAVSSGTSPVFPSDNVQPELKEEGKEKPHQKLLEFLFDEALSQGYRRSNTAVFEPVKLQDGTLTRCYRYKMELYEFVYCSIQSKEQNPEAYNAITLNVTTPKQMVEMLGNLGDPRFPFIQRSRSAFAFRQGVIDAVTCRFYLYHPGGYQYHNVGTVDELPANFAAANFFDADYPLEVTHCKPALRPRGPSGSCSSSSSSSVSSSSSSSSSFDDAEIEHGACYVGLGTPDSPAACCPEIARLYSMPEAAKLSPEDAAWDPMTQKTPELDKILTDQGFDVLSVFWVFALMGRLLQPVGTDDWQVAPYFYGVAGSGKSTLLKILQRVYEFSDNGTIMGDGEKTFCDQHLIDKFIVFAMDIGKDTNLDATRVNSYISGERLAHALKYKTAIEREWNAGLIFASNSQPPFKDVAGNIARRLLIFTFFRPISKSDGKLFERCLAELPLMVAKMIHVYDRALKLFGSVSNLLQVKNLLPDMLHESCKQYMMSCSPLQAILTSTEVVEFGPNFSCSKEDFERSVRIFAQAHHIRDVKNFKLSQIDHAKLFAENNCELYLDSKQSVVSIQGLRVLNLPLSHIGPYQHPVQVGPAQAGAPVLNSRPHRPIPV